MEENQGVSLSLDVSLTNIKHKRVPVLQKI